MDSGPGAVKCERLAVPGGGVAIVCGTRSRQRCECGRPATLLCDWKRPDKRSGTCDAGLCERCTTKPAPDKDLCSIHAAEFEAWKAKRLLPGSGHDKSPAP